jgi:hypothetical protein
VPHVWQMQSYTSAKIDGNGRNLADDSAWRQPGATIRRSYFFFPSGPKT